MLKYKQQRLTKLHEPHHAAPPTMSPMVFIHGFAATRHQWDPLLARLTDLEHPVSVLDLPGHASKPAEFPPGKGLDILLESVLKHLANQGPGPFILVGHSLGGYLSLYLAIHYPTLVERLVLINPLFTQKQIFAPVRWAFRWTPEVLGLIRWTPTPLLGLGARLAFSPRGPQAPTGRNHLVQDALELDPKASQAIIYLPDLTPSLENVRVPVLLLWGGRDITLIPRYYSVLARSLPSHHEQILPHGSHIFHLTNPGWVSEQITGWLSNHPVPI